jgi:hypothetical protein
MNETAGEMPYAKRDNYIIDYRSASRCGLTVLLRQKKAERC